MTTFFRKKPKFTFGKKKTW